LALSQADFEYVRSLVLKRSAIVLENEKLYLAETRLQALARREGLPSLEALIGQARSGTGSGLSDRLVEAMTTNETSFFRDVHPFDALKQVVLPQLIQRRAVERRLSIWCGASSTGQEPYSLAMLLRENFPVLASWNVTILATDLSTEVLEKAKRGRYSQLEINRGLSALLLVKYFVKQGLEWQICEDLRRMVEFRQLNLIEPWPLFPPTDIVMLRNVLIYFSVETKKQILGKVRKILRPDGFLFLGGAETTLNLDDQFERLSLPRSGCYQLRKL
jgi:chemotaxis protein methyltransferase CheR